MSAKAFRIIILLFAAYFAGVYSVTITNLKIPKYFVLSDDSPDHVVLDCEYELNEDQTNIVVKWQKNGDPIYQWIYGEKPTAFPHMKGKINETYEASDDDLQRYRAIALINPSLNTSGEYKCFVLAGKDLDTKSGHLQIIDLKNTTFEITHKEVSDDIHVTCEAKNVFPKPVLRMTLNMDDELPLSSQEFEAESDGYFDASVTGILSSEGINSDSIFGCIMTFDGLNFTASRHISFSGESEQFSFLEQSKNNLPITGDDSSNRCTLNFTIALTVIVLLTFNKFIH